MFLSYKWLFLILITQALGDEHTHIVSTTMTMIRLVNTCTLFISSMKMVKRLYYG